MKRLILVVFITYFTVMLTSCKKVEPVVPTTIDSLKVGLIAYYQFNNSGADSSGKGNHITYYANVTSTSNRAGKPNSAFSFNGQNSYLMVRDNADLRLSNTNFTINTWVKMADYKHTNFGSVIISKRFSGNNKGYNFSVNGIGGPPMGSIFFGPGGGLPGLYSRFLADKNEWCMITVVYDLSTHKAKIYKNAIYDTEAVIEPIDGTINADLYIGRDNPSIGADYFLNGSLDDIRIYNRALTPQQIQRLFVATN